MVIKEFLRKLSYEVKRRENAEEFAKSEFYFVSEKNEAENLELGEVSKKVQPEQ